MSSDSADGRPPRRAGATLGSVEFLLFDSLVHHLIEKGLLTKTDAMSVVQTTAEVVRGQVHENEADSAEINLALATLERTYSSFQALPDRFGRSGLDADNVHVLRTPLHGDQPQFPKDD